MKRLRSSFAGLVFGLLFALFSAQLALALHAAEHDIVLDHADKCVACKSAAQPFTLLSDHSVLDVARHFIVICDDRYEAQFIALDIPLAARPRAPPHFEF